MQASWKQLDVLNLGERNSFRGNVKTTHFQTCYFNTQGPGLSFLI